MNVCKARFASISSGLSQLGLSVVCYLLMVGTLAADTASRRQYALLVGCTEYQTECVDELIGPANDVGRYYQLLTDKKSGFAFPEANVTRLVGWPDDPKLRPTCANITAAFEQLIAEAAPNTQIFVLMAGHGVQVPVPTSRNAFDADNPEPDGMDEVFLPADVQSWKEPDGLRNAIRDDQIGEWLERLQAKGADVWIVFDCCHSGSMSRGAEELERPRSVRPQALGVPDAAIESALKQARTAAGGERSRGLPRFEVGALDLNGEKKKSEGKGSVVAFYAAQAWETAPELPRPRDSPPTKDHYYGLMSYTLAECLHQRQSPMSYRDLARLLVTRYRADRRSRPPTPVFEGDMDREVLGANKWPQRSICLEHHEDQLRLSAGALRGLTRGSVLAVHPPANDTRDPGTVLGYVEVVRLTPVTAEVRPCAFENHSRAQAGDLPELASCTVVSRKFGDMRVKLAVRSPTDASNAELTRETKKVSAALVKLSATVKPLVDVVADETQAEWILEVTTPERARREFGLALERPTVLLFQGEGIARPVREKAAGASRSVAQVNARKVYGQYPASDVARIAAGLNRDLPKIFKWQNIWRIAGAAPDGTQGDRGGLIFDVIALKDRNDESDGEPFEGSSLQAGQIIEYRFENDGDDDLWVAALFLDANFGIELYRARALRSGRAWSPIRVMVTDEALGTEGMVVFTVPMSLCRNEPDYTFLQQEPLGIVDPLSKTRSAMRSSATPFETLMRAATSQAGTRGGRILAAPSNPAVLSRSWVTVPATEAGQP